MSNFNFVTDAQLSKDSYKANNSVSGSVNGWAQIQAKQAANAPLFKHAPALPLAA